MRLPHCVLIYNGISDPYCFCEFPYFDPLNITTNRKRKFPFQNPQTHAVSLSNKEVFVENPCNLKVLQEVLCFRNIVFPKLASFVSVKP